MISSARPPQASFALRLWILHGAFLTAVPLYGVVGAILIRQGVIRSGEPILSGPAASAVLGIMAMLAFMQIVLAFSSGRWLRPLLGKTAETAEDFARQRQIEMIIMDGLLETVAVYGLVGLILGLGLIPCYTLIAAAFLGVLAACGRVRDWTAEHRHRQRMEGQNPQ